MLSGEYSVSRNGRTTWHEGAYNYYAVEKWTQGKTLKKLGKEEHSCILEYDMLLIPMNVKRYHWVRILVDVAP